MRFLQVLLLCSSVFLFSCGNSNTSGKQAAASEPKTPPASKLNEEGTSKLVTVLSKYYTLKDALVKTDGTEASVAAEQLLMATKDFEMFLVRDSSTLQTVTQQIDTLQTASMEISKTHPAEVETMRTSFEKVSDNMFGLLSKMELKNAGVYRQYCSMAFNDKGAHWLSNEEKIMNPYFGKKMLSCGEVTDSLR